MRIIFLLLLSFGINLCQPARAEQAASPTSRATARIAATAGQDELTISSRREEENPSLASPSATESPETVSAPDEKKPTDQERPESVAPTADTPVSVSSDGDKIQEEVSPAEKVNPNDENDQQAAVAPAGEANRTAEPLSDKAVVDGEHVDKKWASYMKRGQEMFEQQKLSRAINAWLSALRKAKKLESNSRLVAITDRRLGEAYTRKERYEKASGYLARSRKLYDQLGIKSRELAEAMQELARHFRILDITGFGKVSSSLKEAGVTKIAVFRDREKSLVEIDLQKRYRAPLEAEDVNMLGLAKKLSFEFANSQTGLYNVAKIKGIQVRTRKLWVNILSSMFNLSPGSPPIAQITAGKMGRTKTVKVTLPEKIHQQTSEILASFTDMINAPLPAAKLQEASTADSSKAGSPSAPVSVGPQTLTESSSDASQNNPPSAEDTTNSGKTFLQKPPDVEEASASDMRDNTSSDTRIDVETTTRQQEGQLSPGCLSGESTSGEGPPPSPDPAPCR